MTVFKHWDRNRSLRFLIIEFTGSPFTVSTVNRKSDTMNNFFHSDDTYSSKKTSYLRWIVIPLIFWAIVFNYSLIDLQSYFSRKKHKDGVFSFPAVTIRLFPHHSFSSVFAYGVHLAYQSCWLRWWRRWIQSRVHFLQGFRGNYMHVWWYHFHARYVVRRLF